jgi:putative MATE family efflux protein
VANYKELTSKIKPLLRDIIDSIKGTEKDYTEGRISKAILLLAIPMVLEMVLESIFAIVDIIVVAQLGADAVATVGITESLMTLVYAIGMGLSTATTAIVARRIGEKEPDKAAVSAVQAILIAIIASFLFSIPGFFAGEEILRLMGVSNDAIKEGKFYTIIMLTGNVVIMLLFVINAIFRSSGDAAISMRILLFANGINIILDPCLVFGWGPFPELGIKGAAIATNLGRGLAVLLQFYYLIFGKKRVQIHLKHVRLKINESIQILKLSLGGIGQMLIATSSWIFLMRILNEFESEVVAGYTLAIRIILFVLLPAWGLSNAAATLVGQNLGAGKPERGERSAWLAGYANIIFLGILGAFLMLYSEFFVKLIVIGAEKPVMIGYGADALKIMSLGFISYAMGMVMINSINGAGDTSTPTIINFFSFWVIEIPLAAFLSFYTQLEYKGVFYAIIISETIMAIVGIIVFKRGKWKLRKV